LCSEISVCENPEAAVVFVSIGTEIHINGNIETAIEDGIRRGYAGEPGVVSDPIYRVNTGDNTPAIIHYSFEKGFRLKISVAPSGFGLENMSRLKMLNPGEGITGVENFITQAVAETLIKTGINTPPFIVGAGVGGTSEKAALLAKEALFRTKPNPDKFWRKCEKNLTEKLNAQAVSIQNYPTYTTGLPVAVNIGYAGRHREIIL
jgi:fumarate hydratase subunit alpha